MRDAGKRGCVGMCPPLRIACHLLASGGREGAPERAAERADCFLAGVH